jgi:hypothetical protein
MRKTPAIVLFRIDDQVQDPLRQRPLLKRAITVCQAQSNGALITTRRLAALVGTTTGGFSDIGRSIPAELCVQHGTRKYYGNPKTIAAYKQQNGLPD